MEGLESLDFGSLRSLESLESFESWEAWKAWRIGAASEAARSRVSRNVIMQSGGWSSSAVDTYMRVQDAGFRSCRYLLEGE